MGIVYAPVISGKTVVATAIVTEVNKEFDEEVAIYVDARGDNIQEVISRIKECNDPRFLIIDEADFVSEEVLRELKSLGNVSVLLLTNKEEWAKEREKDGLKVFNA